MYARLGYLRFYTSSKNAELKGEIEKESISCERVR